MNGFQKEMRTRILGMVPHATISATQPLDDWQTVANAALRHREVVGAAPFAELQGMLSYKGNMLPVLVNGIDPQEERKVSIIGEHIVQGSLTTSSLASSASSSARSPRGASMSMSATS